jgi:hypothetical protein
VSLVTATEQQQQHVIGYFLARDDHRWKPVRDSVITKRYYRMDNRDYPRSVIPDALCCWVRIPANPRLRISYLWDRRQVTESSERVVRVPHRLHMSPKGWVAAF